MADRKLYIEIEVDDKGAKATLSGVEQGVKNVEQAAKTAAPSVQALDTRLDALNTVSSKVTASQNATATATATATTSWKDQVLAYATGMITVQAVERVLVGLINFVKGSITSYAEAEQATRKLTTALTAQGVAVPSVAHQYDVLAKSFQNTTVYSDDLITEMQALLVQVGNVMPKDMERALTAATNLASGLGIDLRTATMLVGKTFAGETGTLKRYGIVVDESRLQTEGFSAVLDTIQQKFGGQAAAEVDTYAGRIAKMGNAWDNVKEAVGGYILQIPIVDRAMRDLTSAADEEAVAQDKVNASGQTWGQFLLHLTGPLGDAILLTNAYAESLNAAEDAETRTAKAADLAYGAIVRSAVARGNWIDARTVSMLQEAIAAMDKLGTTTARTVPTIAAVKDATKQAGAEFTITTTAGDILYTQMGNWTREWSALGAAAAAVATSGLLPVRKLFENLQITVPSVTGTVVTEVKKSEVATLSWRDALREAAQAFSYLAQVADGALSDIARWIGTVITAMNLAVDAGKNLGEGFDAVGEGGKEGAAGAVQLATGIAQAIAAMDAATSSTSKFANAIGGMVTGMQIGGQILPGWGHVIGAIAGLIVGLARDTKRVTGEMRQDFVNAHGGLNELQKAADLAGISLSGLWNTKDIKQWQREVQMIDALLQQWQRRIQNLSSAATGLGKMVEAFAAPFLALFAELDKASDDAKTQILKDLAALADQGQAEFERLGTYATVVFASILKETGSLAQAFDAVGPSLDTLIDLQKKLGFTASETVQALLDIRQVVNANKEVMQSVDGLLQLMNGLIGAVPITQGLFNAFAADASTLFGKLIANGVDSTTALALMQPVLQNLWMLQHQYGFAVDDATAELLKQAEAAGLVGAAHRSVNEKMLEALLGIKTAIEDLVTALTQHLGGALGNLGNQVGANVGEWLNWHAHVLPLIQDVGGAVDAVSFGLSPGGIKEWPILLAKSEDAFSSWADHAVTELGKVEQATYAALSPWWDREEHPWDWSRMPEREREAVLHMKEQAMADAGIGGFGGGAPEGWEQGKAAAAANENVSALFPTLAAVQAEIAHQMGSGGAFTPYTAKLKQWQQELSGRGGGTSIVVHVDARESFYDTPDGRRALAKKVGDSVAQVRSRSVRTTV